MQEEHLFALPQQLSPLGFIINILKTFVKIIKQFFFFIAYILYRQRESLSATYIWFVLIAIILITVVVAWVNFRTFKYYVDDEAEEFVLQKGLFNKSKIVIKFTNILQVNITQNMIQKALSLYSLTLDTAGSDKVEVDLYALDGYRATELKKLLLSKIHGTKDTIIAVETEILHTAPNPSSKIMSLPAKNILLVSLFSNYRQGLALFVAFLVTMFQNFKDAFETFEISDEDIDANAVKQLALDSLFVFAGTILILLLTIPFLINLVRYYLKYYNFTIVKNASGNFSMQYGLTKKVNTIFNKDKIQFITFKQNQIVKKFGIGILSLKQLVADSTKDDKGSIVMPGIEALDKDKVYDLAFSAAVFEEYHYLKPKIGLFISRCIKMVILVGVLFILLSNIDIDRMFVYPTVLILVITITLYNYLFYKNYTLLYNDNYIVKKYGVWNEKETVIPMDRLQGVEVSQTIFQQRASSANLSVSTAAGSIHFLFYPQEQVNHLSNYLLYKVEK